MKLNWGTSIAIFYALFVIIMVGMVVYASKQDVNMVQDNYYDKDLNYESFRTSRANAEAISDKIDINYFQGKNIVLTLPDNMVVENGKITMYRPSNRHLDKQFNIELDSKNSMHISTEHLMRGAWRIIIDWTHDGKSFHHEEQLVL
ncbi:MAG: hypothetical protein HKN87_09445 [Saprospiraceae bacterium]|nr:hypothetical protein [Saprospiraceae bacterium]